MDEALELMRAGQGREATERLSRMLAERRLSLDAADWRQFAGSTLKHPIREYLHADPFTFRAYAKPRGYAGDAVMMDYLYGYIREALEPPIDQVFAYNTVEKPAAGAVRERRKVVAKAIDDAVVRCGRDIEVVAIACGHLREVDLLTPAANRLAHITALDSDEESLGVIRDEYFDKCVSTVHGSVRQILSGRVTLGRADLVYSIGLYDYLAKPVATRLTTLLFSAVRPGGTLFLANFLPDIQDVGYMESFMDWHLIYRTDRELRELADALPAGDVAGIRQYHDALDNIGFLEITRR